MVRSKRSSCGLAGGRRRVKRGSLRKYSNAHKEMLRGRKENWVKLYSPSGEMLGGRKENWVKLYSPSGEMLGGRRKVKRGTHHEMKTRKRSRSRSRSRSRRRRSRRNNYKKK